jgi:hypothetical protein
VKHGIWLAVVLLLAGCKQPTETVEVVREIVVEVPAPEREPERAAEKTAEPAAEPVLEPEIEPEPLPGWWIEGGKLWRSADGVTAREAGDGGDWRFTDDGGAYRVWMTHIQYGPGDEAFFLWLGEYSVTTTGFVIIALIDSAETGGEAWSAEGGVITAGYLRFAVSAAGFEEV